jgi:hypothetical protein
LVLLAKPYVLEQIENTESYSSIILAHQQENIFNKAAIQVLYGDIDAVGTLPVSVKGF